MSTILKSQIFLSENRESASGLVLGVRSISVLRGLFGQSFFGDHIGHRDEYVNNGTSPERVFTISREQSSMLCPMSKIPVSDEPRTSVVAERHGHPRPCKNGPSTAGKDERQRTFRRSRWSAAVSIHKCRSQSVPIRSGD